MWLVIAACLAAVLGGCGPQAGVSESPSQAATALASLPTGAPSPSTFPTPVSSATPVVLAEASPPSTPAASLPTIDAASGLHFIDPVDLPTEALDALALIEAGGPFPFDRDGLTFQNREELLPEEHGGYYREFTVITPGLSHRGARRIVAGEAGERYYTDDHYESFERIRLPGTDP